MNELIEAKPMGGAAGAIMASGGDQASALRALVDSRAKPGTIRRNPAARVPVESVLRIAWLAEREYPELRAAIAGLAGSVGQQLGGRVAWDARGGQPIGDERTNGLLIVCDSCTGAAEALRRTRQAVARGAWLDARTEASNAWIGVIGLAGDVVEQRILSASLRGLRDTVELLMDESIQLLGVHRVRRRRGLWYGLTGGSIARGLSDELCQEVEKFLHSRALSACAIR